MRGRRTLRMLLPLLPPLLFVSACAPRPAAPAATTRPASPATRPAEPLVITHGPYLMNADQDAATIVWFTNRRCVSRVEYGTDDSLGSTAVSARHGLVDAYTLAHAVTLKGLKPGTAYRYRVCSKEIVSFRPYKVVFGQTVVSPPAGFSTLDARKEAFSFIMVNDIHGKAAALDERLRAVQWGGVDMVFLNGDSTSYIEAEKHLFDGFLDTCVQRFAGSIPLTFVRGNHETRGVLARSLDQYLPPREGRYYGAFSHGGVRFVVLDTGEDKPDSSDVYAGLVAFDDYRREQAAWLEKEVQQPAFRQATWRVVVAHIPPWGGAEWHGEKHMRQVWGPILNRAGVDVMLCGHLHRYAHLKPAAGANAFPILVNAHDTLLRADVDRRQLTLRVTGKDGMLVEEFALTARPERAGN